MGEKRGKVKRVKVSSKYGGREGREMGGEGGKESRVSFPMYVNMLFIFLYINFQ